MPNGTIIDPDTVRDSLSRVIPMIKQDHEQDLVYLQFYEEQGHECSDWRQHCEDTAKLIVKAESIINTEEMLA